MKTYSESEVKELIYRAIRNHEDILENTETEPFVTIRNGCLSSCGQIAYDKTLEIMEK